MKKAIWSKWWQLKKIFNFTCLKDTGIGVEENLQNKIFDRFSQGNLDLSKQNKGTELGLAITKKIVELFNGEIWLN